MIGTTLGHYRILELLGQGGMGTVYLAEDTRLRRRVALKVLARELASDGDRRERFEREARAAAALNHPNIVSIHSVEEIDGQPFLTLELVEGQTLAAMIPADGLSLDRLLALAIPLADAVGAAHQRGITHRDLKPANVMVGTDGRVKVLDFGLAKLKEDAHALVQAGLPTGDLTGEGRIVGTVAYMAPEQAEGKPVDPRSDVFALGVMLYEMATGRRPFTGDTQLSVLSSIIKDTPKSVTDLKGGLPRDLGRIIRRCMAKDPEDRYQTAKDLRNDLRALKDDLASGEVAAVEPARAAAASGRRNRMAPWAAGAGVAVIAVVAATAIMRWSSPPTNGVPPSRPFDAIALSRLTTTGTAGMAAISKDGRYVAYVSAKDGRASLWLRQVATSSNVQVVPPAQVRYDGVTFAPDGNHIYYSVYPVPGNIATLFQVPVLGGGSRRIVEDIDTPPTFSPDGTQMAFLRGFSAAHETAVFLSNVDGSGLRELMRRKAPPTFSLEGLAWSPDGRTIVVPGHGGSLLRAELVMVDAASGREQVLPTREWRDITHIAWLPDGSGLLVNAQESAGESSSQIWLVSYPSGTARRITNDLSAYTGLSLSSDGKAFVCVRNELRSTLWIVPIADPAKAQALAADAGTDDGVNGINWTPDGRIVYAAEASGNPDVWLMNVDGTRRVQLTSSPGLDISPRVTSDGRFIVFVSDRDGAVRAWRMGLDGSSPTRLSADVIMRWRVSLSADGKWVYYNDPTGDSRKVSIDGGAPISVFKDPAYPIRTEPLPQGFHEPMPSPDGTVVAGHYVDPDARGERIVLIPLGPGAAKRFPAIPPSGVWTPDGRGLLYIDTKEGVSNLLRQSIAGGPPTQLTRFAADRVFTFAMSPDQRQLAVVRGQVASDVVLIASGQK